MVKLRRLSIQKYRAVKPGTELSFNDGYNVLLGINGTGKTTLLKLIAMCLSCSFAGLEEEEFVLEYELELPEAILKVAVKNQRVETKGVQPINWESTINVQCQPKNSVELFFSFRLEKGILYLNQLELKKNPSLFTPCHYYNFVYILLQDCHIGNFANIDQPDEYISTFWATIEPILKSLIGQRFWSRFDEATVWLDEVLEKTSLELFFINKHLLIYPERIAIATELNRAVQERILNMDHSGSWWEQVKFLTFRQDELPFLAQAVTAFNYKDANLHLELQGAKYDAEQNNSLELKFGKMGISFTKRDGTYLLLEKLSFGQKRLVAFYYYLASSPYSLIADELANGMHHAMIEKCLDAAGSRQMFLATQNPLLLDHVPIESVEQVRSTFIRCGVTTEGKRERMVWSALTEEEATSFFKDYEVGIQHTNDILRTRGLW